MKLVLATPLYPPEFGGPATYAQLLVDGMAPHGVEIELVKFSDVRHLPSMIRHLVYLSRLMKVAGTADAILALDPVSVGFPAAIAAFMSGKPLVVKIVGDFAWEQGRQRFGVAESLDDFVHRANVPFAVACMRMAQTFVARRAKRIIVPSEYLKGIITAWGISPQKITVIYNSVEIPNSDPEAVPVSQVKDRVLTVARLVPWKGIEGLIEAIATVHANVLDISLLVVGDGPDKETLMERSDEQLGGHGVRTLFTGSQSHEQVLVAMHSAGVFVLNSTYEGLSHVLIEALSLGCVVVATRVGGNPELITDGENGLLVPSGDTAALAVALQRALQDEELRVRMSANAKMSVVRFSPETMLSETATLLTSLQN